MKITLFRIIYKLTGVLALATAVAYGVPLKTTHEPSFLLCTGKNFTGYCVNISAPTGVCSESLLSKYAAVKSSSRVLVTYTDELNDKISSMQGVEVNTCLHFV